MSQSDPPPVYGNPVSDATTQAGLNLAAAEESQAGSMVGQENPFGSVKYAQSGTGPGGVPLYTATTQLSPQMQAILTSLQSGVTGQLGTAGYDQGNAASVIGDATAGNTKALLGQETSYLQPFFTQQQEQLDAQLRNQGIGPESPAYTTAMNNLSQSQNQSVTGFLAQAEPAAFQQATTAYTLPASLSAQLMNIISPGSFNASLINPPQASVNPPNYEQDVSSYNQAQQQAYNTQATANANLWGNLFKIPSAVLGGWAGSDAGGAAITSALAGI